MVSALNSGSNGLGLKPVRGHSIVIIIVVERWPLKESECMDCPLGPKREAIVEVFVFVSGLSVICNFKTWIFEHLIQF